MDIIELLTFSIKQAASDLHISAGLPPLIRVDGDLLKTSLPPLEQETAQRLIYSIMNEQQRKGFEQTWEAAFSFDIPELTRLRVNVFNHSRGIAAVLRIIPQCAQTLDELGLPNIFKQICGFSHGLVLVSGPTSSGKSTTLAAMLDYINEHHYNHVLTIEDPIEFIHYSKKSLIHQREIQRDTTSFSAALRSALREDPNTVMIGEMRDIETFRLALTAAEAGYLVLASLHTASATKTIHRIIDVFPPTEKSLVRSMLAETLQAVVCQNLLKKINGGRVAGLEIMLGTPAIRNLIREDKTTQIYSTLQTNLGMGMQTLDHHLKLLVANQTISRRTAKLAAVNKELFS